MTNGIYLKCGEKLYRIHNNAKCTRRTCSLFVRGVCDDERNTDFPCAWADAKIREAGLSQHWGVNFKEVAK